MLNSSKWSTRFFYSALAQGALIFVATIYLFVYGSLYLKPSPAMVIASGSAGTWLLVGYAFYILMAMYLGVTAFFYNLLEKNTGKQGKGYNLFSLAHFVLVNLGTTGITFLLMYAGYAGGAALLPAAVGGGGLTQGQVHMQILGSLPLYAVALLLMVSLGSFCGGVSYYLAFKKK